jgi:hypothetical protein
MRRRLLIAGFLWTQLAGWVWAAPCRDISGTFVKCPEMSVRFYAGVEAGKASDIDARPLPTAGVHIEAPLSDLPSGPWLHVDTLLRGLPSGDVSLEDPSSVKAFDGSAAIVQRLWAPLRFSVYARAGLASRLSEATADSERLPVYGSVGLDFRSERGYLQVGVGPDQRLSGEAVPSVVTLAGVQVAERAGLKLWLTGSVIRALDLSAYGYRTPRRDYWSLSLMVAR